MGTDVCLPSYDLGRQRDEKTLSGEKSHVNSNEFPKIVQ